MIIFDFRFLSRVYYLRFYCFEVISAAYLFLSRDTAPLAISHIDSIVPYISFAPPPSPLSFCSPPQL